MSRANLLFASFAIALFSTLGSLYFSEVLHFAPCILCWYQRIVMYPISVILFVGILLKDKNLPYFVLPLSLAGLVISLDQNLLYYKIISGEILPCSTFSPCTARFIKALGFLDIPQLSFLSFLTITSLMVLYLKSKK